MGEYWSCRRDYLDKNYSGWKQTSVATDCFSELARAVVAGDFDGDRKRDYAVKIIRGRKGYIIAILDRGTRVEAHVLVSESAADIKSMGLNIARKGEKYPIGGDYPDFTYGRLPNDAPVIGPCASEASPLVDKNGRFE